MTVAVPKSAALTEELRLTGTVTAERSARVSARVDGLVARLHADAGQTVDAGDTLMELDATMARLGLRRAEAQVGEAKARANEAERLLREARRLAADRHIPLTDVDTREAEAKLAQAALAAAEAARAEQAEVVRRHALPAPFAGVVARRLTDVGEWVTRGTPVFEVVATDRVRLDVHAPQERFRSIAPESEVIVRSDALPGQALKGRVVARVPVSNPDARTFLVRIVVDDPPPGLLPGTSATAVIGLSGPERSALLVPRDALLRHPDGGYSVFVVDGDAEDLTARRRTVKLGRTDDANVEVLSGLRPGERVVTRGNEVLRDGQPVRIAQGT